MGFYDITVGTGRAKSSPRPRPLKVKIHPELGDWQNRIARVPWKPRRASNPKDWGRGVSWQTDGGTRRWVCGKVYVSFNHVRRRRRSDFIFQKVFPTIPGRRIIAGRAFGALRQRQSPCNWGPAAWTSVYDRPYGKYCQFPRSQKNRSPSVSA